ncbi:MAG: hypothetical protein OXG13_14500 [Gemmatimonadaceae bacterium]|nr:hypothetical protein [Gemmatimonadaceae bacterium]
MRTYLDQLQQILLERTRLWLMLGAASLLPGVLPTNADPEDPRTRPAEVPRPPVLLEAGAIDSSNVELGATAVVIYGLGYRQSSGEWPRQARASGVVQAVDRHRLLLALEGQDRPQRIDLRRMQRLILVGPVPPGSTDAYAAPPGGAVDINKTATGELPSSMQRQDRKARGGIRGLVNTLIMGDLPDPVEPPAETIQLDTAPSSGAPGLQGHSPLERNDRISRKLATSTLLSLGIVYGGFKFLERSCGGRSDDPDDLGTGFCVLEGLPLTTVSGSLVAVPLGVTMWDPHDNPGAAWLGSLTGLLGGVAFSIGLETFFPVVLGPPIMATMMSEWSRGYPGPPRFSMGLVPNRQGRLSAVATLRL